MSDIEAARKVRSATDKRTRLWYTAIALSNITDNLTTLEDELRDSATARGADEDIVLLHGQLKALRDEAKAARQAFGIAERHAARELTALF